MYHNKYLTRKNKSFLIIMGHAGACFRGCTFAICYTKIYFSDGNRVLKSYEMQSWCGSWCMRWHHSWYHQSEDGYNRSFGPAALFRLCVHNIEVSFGASFWFILHSKYYNVKYIIKLKKQIYFTYATHKK